MQWFHHGRHEEWKRQNRTEKLIKITAKRGSLRIEQLGTLMRSSPGCLLCDRGWAVGMEPESRWPSSPHRCGVLVLWQRKPGRQGSLKMRTRPLHLHGSFRPWLLLFFIFFLPLASYVEEKKRGACFKNRSGSRANGVLKTHFFPLPLVTQVAWQDLEEQGRKKTEPRKKEGKAGSL